MLFSGGLRVDTLTSLFRVIRSERTKQTNSGVKRHEFEAPSAANAMLVKRVVHVTARAPTAVRLLRYRRSEIRG
jgi:hypothetical protein